MQTMETSVPVGHDAWAEFSPTSPLKKLLPPPPASAVLPTTAFGENGRLSMQYLPFVAAGLVTVAEPTPNHSAGSNPGW